MRSTNEYSCNINSLPIFWCMQHELHLPRFLVFPHTSPNVKPEVFLEGLSYYRLAPCRAVETLYVCAMPKSNIWYLCSISNS